MASDAEMASGVKRTTVHNWFEAGGKRKKFSRCFQQHLEKRGGNVSIFYDSDIIVKSKATKDLTPLAVKEIRKLWEFLYADSTSNMGIPSLALEYGFNIKDAMDYRSAAHGLSSMKAEKGTNPQYIHETLEEPPEPAKSAEKIRLACPAWPDGEDNSIFFFKLARKLWAMLVPEFPLHTMAYRAISYYIHRSWCSEKNLYFLSIEKDGDEAANYVKFLKSIRINKKDIYFKSYDSSSTVSKK